MNIVSFLQITIIDEVSSFTNKINEIQRKLGIRPRRTRTQQNPTNAPNDPAQITGATNKSSESLQTEQNPAITTRSNPTTAGNAPAQRNPRTLEIQANPEAECDEIFTKWMNAVIIAGCKPETTKFEFWLIYQGNDKFMAADQFSESFHHLCFDSSSEEKIPSIPQLSHRR